MTAGSMLGISVGVQPNRSENSRNNAVKFSLQVGLKLTSILMCYIELSETSSKSPIGVGRSNSSCESGSIWSVF